MKIDMVKERLCELTMCFQFEYNGKQGGIDPFHSKKFECFYNNETQTVCSIDEALKTPFVAGKTIEEIIDKIRIIAW